MIYDRKGTLQIEVYLTIVNHKFMSLTMFIVQGTDHQVWYWQNLKQIYNCFKGWDDLTTYLKSPGANVVKLFCPWFTYFRTKLECVLG
jgi:hypothetical protein